MNLGTTITEDCDYGADEAEALPVSPPENPSVVDVRLTPPGGLNSLLQVPVLGLLPPQISPYGKLTLTGAIWARWTRDAQRIPYLVMYPHAGGRFQVLVGVEHQEGDRRFTYLISDEFSSESAAWASLKKRLGIAEVNPDPLPACAEDSARMNTQRDLFLKTGQVEIGGPGRPFDPHRFLLGLFGLAEVPADVKPYETAMVITRTDNPYAVVMWPSCGTPIQVVTATSSGLVLGPSFASLGQALEQAGATRLVRPRGSS